jgi:ribosomal protein S18 acetylase RimI-like enzyme
MIKQISESDISQLTRIHIEALKGDFLPSLGFGFLSTVYKGLINQKEIYGFKYEYNKKIVGFVIGTKNMDIFFKFALRSNFIQLSFLLFLQILKRPGIIKNIVETFLYPKKDQGVKSELVVIALLKKWQGKGIGKKLVKALEGKFLENRIKKYKLTVHADKAAVKFYENLKFLKIAKFNLYGKDWYIYEKKIK